MFKKARALDPAHTKTLRNRCSGYLLYWYTSTDTDTNTLRNSEMLALLRSPAVGLTAVEADLLVRRYLKLRVYEALNCRAALL